MKFEIKECQNREYCLDLTDGEGNLACIDNFGIDFEFIVNVLNSYLENQNDTGRD